MARSRKRAKQAGTKKGVDRVSSAYLDKLIEEATVDCYNETEEITGIFTLLEENLGLPFTTKLLGMEVTVEAVDLNAADDIVAVCRRGCQHQRVCILDLPLPEARPEGAEWIEAYRRWARGR